jgi:hypothetical protein
MSPRAADQGTLFTDLLRTQLTLPSAIRLGEHRAYGGGDAASGARRPASVPFFLIGVVAAGWSAVERRLPFIEGLFTRRPAYRSVPIDEDAEILGTYEDD